DNNLYSCSFGSQILINCILWNNMAGDSTDESAQVSPPFIINYSCVQGWTGTWGGTGNIGDDPCFVVPGHFNPDPN
ncbi:MAG: hypothetical protein GWO10_16950, partial [candidate division Zixibacteria bacterium]|nr:hypothetical protein [Phycisphaerae bacterium]NIR65410.1 hypothetical protein [candidate division Zixibacteria bacterium]NIW97702.1 hypothetical protein [Phycisphaerae bacterium]